MSYAIGVDINNRYSQISVYTDDDRNPVPVSAVVGQDFYEIPTLVAYVENQNRWCYGYEAYSLSEAEAAVAVDNLMERAMNGEIVTIHGEEYPVTDLLELYIKKLLGMANLIAPYHLADVIVFSAELLNHESISFLNSVIKRLSIEPEKIHLMSHSECIHYYMIHQNRELWMQDVLVLDYAADELYGKIYNVRRSTKPIVCSTDEYRYDYEAIDSDEKLIPVIEELLSGRIVSSVYLIGDGDLEKRCPKAISTLCAKRRAFMGRNLYTRGACYAAMEYAKRDNNSMAYIFLGRDKIKCNVLTYIRNEDGKEELSELIEAGVNWYDVSVDLKFYLDAQREVRLALVPIDGSDERNVIIRLNDFPKRPPRTTLISLRLVMTEPDMMKASVTDMGFGEIFPATEIVVEELIDLGE